MNAMLVQLSQFL